MEKFKEIYLSGGIGALAGVILAEFFPKALNPGLLQSLESAFGGPFSEARNELALKYGLGGLVIGALVGVVIMFMEKK
ncbi:MAG: hypothetical protein LLG37_07940 [Spirochaetia bacterium]|nr:hypothetical protein [Spirochaetia bacterium]